MSPLALQDPLALLAPQDSLDPQDYLDPLDHPAPLDLPDPLARLVLRLCHLRHLNRRCLPVLVTSLAPPRPSQ